MRTVTLRATVASLRPLIRPFLLLCGLLAAGLAIRELPGIGHPGPGHPGGIFSRGLLRDGLHGRVIFLCVGTLVCAAGLPRQAVGFAGGFAYGTVMGTLLTTAATLTASLVDLLWARMVGRDWARRRLLRGRMARLDSFIARNPFTAILTLRLLPVGSSLMLSLLAGVLDVRILPFLGATLLGSLPQTVIFVLIGSGTRIGQATQIVLGIALLIASGIGGGLLLRRGAVREISPHA
jgi:uncharacterized membrane protein YdjX (TVP38/TMEM64 family)